MNFQQWTSLGIIIIMAAYPILFPAWSYFFRMPEMQRETLKFYAPIAARTIVRNKETDMPLAVAFVVKSFWKHRLWPLPVEQIEAAIKAELREV